MESKWRRERDSNPRYPFGYNGFQDRRFQPLTHPSAARKGSNSISLLHMPCGRQWGRLHFAHCKASAVANLRGSFAEFNFKNRKGVREIRITKNRRDLKIAVSQRKILRDVRSPLVFPPLFEPLITQLLPCQPNWMTFPHSTGTGTLPAEKSAGSKIPSSRLASFSELTHGLSCVLYRNSCK
jgi:hypothetical protein